MPQELGDILNNEPEMAAMYLTRRAQQEVEDVAADTECEAPTHTRGQVPSNLAATAAARTSDSRRASETRDGLHLPAAGAVATEAAGDGCPTEDSDAAAEGGGIHLDKVSQRFNHGVRYRAAAQQQHQSGGHWV